MSWLGGIKLKPTGKDAKGPEAAGFSVQLKPVQKDAPPAVNPLLNVSLKKVIKDAPEKTLPKPKEEDNLLSPFTFDCDDKVTTKKIDDLAEKPKSKEKSETHPGKNETSSATQSIKKEDTENTNSPEPVVTKTAAGRPFIIGDGLRNIVARRGQIGKFEIKFGGRPEPNCTWSREGVDLVSDGKKIKIESSLGKSNITIRDAVRGDTAIYKATISNSKGTCDSEAEFVVLDKPPTPKGPLLATEIRPTSIALKWNKPEREKDMDAISGYILEKLDLKTGKWTRAGMCGPYEDTIRAENLTANTTYKFRIKAVNKEGESDPLEIDDTVTTTEATGELFPPDKPKVTYASEDSVDINWKNAEEGVQAAKFVVQMKKKDSGEWADVAEVTDRSSKAHVKGLEEDSTYDFRILAVDDAGRSEPSKATTATRASAACIDRTNLGKRIVGEGEMISMEIGVKGYPPPTCTWTFRGQEVQNDRMKASNEEDNKAILIVYKADRQDAGTYTLKAVNDSGEDEVTLEFVVACKPGPPRGPLEVVTAEEDDHHVLHLTWQKPEDDGGSDAEIVYRVFKKSTSATEWEEVGETEKLEMNVAGVPEGETCFFKVVAWNSQGESDGIEAEITIKRPIRKQSQCSVHLKAARIESMLEDVTVEEGDDISFSTAYSGEPPPTLTWYHDSKEVFPSETTTISNDGRTSTLSIKNAKPEHRGTYTLIASNPSGEDELSASVTFMKNPMDPTDLTVTETEGAEGECTLEWKPNSFDVPTHYQVFKCLEGTEDWMPISRVREPRAVVSGLLPSQRYKFRVCAINSYGLSKGIVTEYTRATRQRKALPEVQLQRPKFIRELSFDCNLSTKELVLECEATSDSLVTPQWFRNGREIKYNPRFRWEVYGGIYRLYISKFERIDGEYTCLLTNSAGKNESSTRVKYEDLNYRRRNFQQPDPIHLTNINSFFYGTHGYPHKGSLYKPMQWHRARNLFQRIACTVENDFEPYFTFCLRPRIVQYREDSCKLTCCISGNPKPQVTWYFESRELDKMEYNITFVDGVATLQIEDCKPQDSGEYRCVASNSKGSCEGSCVVVIENRKKKYR